MHGAGKSSWVKVEKCHKVLPRSTCLKSWWHQSEQRTELAVHVIQLGAALCCASLQTAEGLRSRCFPFLCNGLVINYCKYDRNM